MINAFKKNISGIKSSQINTLGLNNNKIFSINNINNAISKFSIMNKINNVNFYKSLEYNMNIKQSNCNGLIKFPNKNAFWKRFKVPEKQNEKCKKSHLRAPILDDFPGLYSHIIETVGAIKDFEEKDKIELQKRLKKFEVTHNKILEQRKTRESTFYVQELEQRNEKDKDNEKDRLDFEEEMAEYKYGELFIFFS